MAKGPIWGGIAQNSADASCQFDIKALHRQFFLPFKGDLTGYRFNVVVNNANFGHGQLSTENENYKSLKAISNCGKQDAGKSKVYTFLLGYRFLAVG
jgi:hypothetical protein